MLDGLKTEDRSGRYPKLDHGTFVKVKGKVARNESGWTVKKVTER